jgi:hypothetical protein
MGSGVGHLFSTIRVFDWWNKGPGFGVNLQNYSHSGVVELGSQIVFGM